MDLTLREAAKILHVEEETVESWVRAGTIPSHRYQDREMFSRTELQEWAVLNKRPITSELLASNGSGDLPPRLADAVERGGVHYRVPGGNRETALRAVAQSPTLPPRVNRDELSRLLIGRESASSTGIGDGIAIPHPRSPLVVRVDEPVVIVSRLDAPADFHAHDGKPVHTLFTLLSPSARLHLLMLAKIAYALRDEKLKELLNAETDAKSIITRIRAIEDAIPSKEHGC